MVYGVGVNWGKWKQHPIASSCLTAIQSKFYYCLPSAIIGQLDENISFSVNKAALQECKRHLNINILANKPFTVLSQGLHTWLLSKGSIFRTLFKRKSRSPYKP